MSEKIRKGQIIGIGGIFFKAENPKKLQEWYSKHLGFTSQVPYMEGDDAITFRWKSSHGENENTVWAPFKKETNYFKPSKKDFMINYIVKNIEEMLNKLESEGIKPVGQIEQQPFGKFARIVDPEGNKIEFWEPNREFFREKY